MMRDAEGIMKTLRWLLLGVLAVAALIVPALVLKRHFSPT